MANRNASITGVLVVVALIGLVLKFQPDPVVPEDRERGFQEVREAFAAPALHEGALPAGIAVLFHDLGRELKAAGGVGAGRCFDSDRMALESDPQRKLTRSQRDSLAARLKGGLDNVLRNLAQAIDLDRTEIRGLRWYVEGTDAVVVTRHASTDDDDGDISCKMRWWIVYRGGIWQFYDFEEMDGGGRITTLFGSLLRWSMDSRMDFATLQKLTQFVEQIKAARAALALKDFAEADRILEAPVPPEMPVQIRAVVDMLRGIAKMGIGEWQPCIDSLARTEALDPSITGIHLTRAIAYNSLGRHEEAIASARKYLELLGPDEAAYFQSAIGCAALGRLDEARDAFRKGFDEVPNSPNDLDGFRQALEPGKKKEFGERFAKLSRPTRHFTRLFGLCMHADDHESATALVEAYRKFAPDDPQGAIREGQVLLKTDRFDEAGKRFLEALAMPLPKAEPLPKGGPLGGPKEGVADADGRLSQCLYLYAAKRGEASAYALFAPTDARPVFRILLDSILADDDSTDDPERVLQTVRLDALIALHRVREPKDPWIAFATGERHVEAKDYGAAEKAFAEAMEKCADAADRTTILYSRVSSLCAHDRGPIAYDSVDPTPRTFDQVATYMMYSTMPVDRLAELVALRQKREPKADDLHYWNGQLAWLKQDYLATAKHMRRFRDLDGTKYAYAVNDRLFRSLLRSGQTVLAQQQILDAKEFGQTTNTGPALIAAHAGDVEKLGEEMELLKTQGYQDAGFHYDEDLGPLLRGKPELRSLLKKYPMPKDFLKKGNDL